MQHACIRTRPSLDFALSSFVSMCSYASEASHPSNIDSLAHMQLTIWPCKLLQWKAGSHHADWTATIYRGLVLHSLNSHSSTLRAGMLSGQTWPVDRVICVIGLVVVVLAKHVAKLQAAVQTERRALITRSTTEHTTATFPCCNRHQELPT